MLRKTEAWFVCAVVAAGLALRIKLAVVTALNPDEAEHALWSFGTLAGAFQNSLGDTHPPLLTLLTHFVSKISRGQVALRMIPVLAGSAFPVLVLIWLRRISGNIAAMTALLLLTLAPALIAISAQLRTYTLALLLLAAALVVLEEAIDDGRPVLMGWYGVLLWLCMVADYSMAWFAGAAGVYAWLRLRGSSMRLRGTWAAGQAVALATYAAIAIHIRGFRGTAMERGAWDGWLRNAVPQPGDGAMFLVSRTVDQFAYLMGSARLGKIACILFAAAVVWLVWGRSGMERRRALAVACLLSLPFAFGILGAYARLFPYGRTRHTLVLGLFGAVGVAIFMSALPRRMAGPLVWAMLAAAPLWYLNATATGDDLPGDRNRRSQMVECVDWMRAEIPAGSLIFTEQESYLTLAYYLGDGEKPAWQAGAGFHEAALGGRWRAAVRDYAYPTREQYAGALAAFRVQYGLAEHDPVWVVDGGWNAVAGPPDEARPFTRAVRVFQAR